MENNLSIQLDDFDLNYINGGDNNNNLMEIAFEGNDSTKKDDLFETSFINNSLNSMSKSIYSNKSLPCITYDKEDCISPPKKSKKLKKSSVAIEPLNSSFDSYYDKSISSSTSKLKKRKDKKVSSKDKKKSKLDKLKKKIGKFFNVKTNYSANISNFISEFIISIRLKTSASAISEGNYAWPIIDVYRGFKVLLFTSSSNKDHKVLLLCICVGILLSFISEICVGTPRYNILILLVLLMSDEFHFPLHTVRPQIVLTLIIVLSVCLDIFYLNFITPKTATLSRVLIGYTSVAKLIGLYKLVISRKDARKYLVRRVRLFGIPLQLPRRIMRDVRARILAIGILQFFATFAYFILLVIAITVFNYNVFMIKPWRGAI